MYVQKDFKWHCLFETCTILCIINLEFYVKLFFGNHRYSGINFYWIAFVVIVVGQFLNLLILKMLLINGMKILALF